MSDDSALQKEIANLLPFESDSAAPGQVPIVLGEVKPDKFLYIGKGLTADEFSGYVQSYDFGKVPPDYVVLHQTANPCTLAAAYPAGHAWDGAEAGLSDEQIYQKRLRGLLNMREYYQYGESEFLFSVLELCAIEHLNEREQHWIDATRCNQRVYGFNRRVVAESDRGLKREGQALENIRQANKRQDYSHLHTPEAREKARQAAAKRRGVAFTDAHKAKLSKAKIGTKRKPEVVMHFGATTRQQFASLTAEERARRVAPKGMERVFILTDLDGNEHHVLNLSAFCTEHGFDRAAFTRIMMGKKKNYKGWTCRRLV
jgi:hypothetical protein